MNFKSALLSLNKLEAIEIFHNFERDKLEQDFIEDIMVPILEEVGDGWKNGEVSLAQIYICGSICEEIVNIIYKPIEMTNEAKSKIAIVTLDDYHSLGKKIVYSVLRTNKIDVLDFGAALSVDEVIRLIIENNIEILIISALMYPSALRVKEFRKRLIDSNMDIKIVVGGAPFRLDDALWKSVNADAMGDAPMDTVNVIKEMRGLAL